ncbi:MAG: transposase [Sulfurimonas sp.]|nr:transposase [Sulfurimonas sp.]
MKLHKKLPHIDAKGHYQFVTFRTNDSLDSFIQKLINDTTIKQPIKQYKIDNILDNSVKGAYLNKKVLIYLYNFLKELENEVYRLKCFVIMPNHVHILFEQLKPIDETIRVIKSKSAIAINRLLGKSGKFWAADYYDKVIRDEEHFRKVYEYIKNNSLKVGLCLEDRFYSVYED